MKKLNYLKFLVMFLFMIGTALLIVVFESSNAWADEETKDTVNQTCYEAISIKDNNTHSITYAYNDNSIDYLNKNLNTQNVKIYDFESEEWRGEEGDWTYNIDKSFANYKPINGSYCFMGAKEIYGIEYFNTKYCLSTERMFYRSTLKSLDLSKFDTYKVKNMSYMFFECSNLENLDISNFNTQHVEKINQMFGECSSLTKLNFNTCFYNYYYRILIKDSNFKFSYFVNELCGECSNVAEIFYA